MVDGRPFVKNNHMKSLWARYLMNRWLDHIQILCSGTPGISNDLISFLK